MSVQTSQARLADAVKQLNVRWNRIRERWDDGVARQVQKEYIDPLGPMVRSAVQALNHVSDLMAAAQRDCDNDP